MPTMATEFVMPVQHFQASPTQTQYSLYSSQSQQISPINSATATPTSPRSALPPHLPTHTRQLRPPKSPLYVPAVLRPTDPPRRVQKSSPLTPPSSTHNSFEDLNNTNLSRRSTGDSGKFDLGVITEAEWSAEGLGKVTAPPTKDHWKPDSETNVCDDVSCSRHFTYFTRKHHCRRCGNIFCDLHSLWLIPLDQDANYHPQGYRSRACEHCFSDYRAWHIQRSSRSNSESSEPTTPTTPTVSCAGKRSSIGAVFGGKNQGTPESLGASVPRDWNWSTF